MSQQITIEPESLLKVSAAVEQASVTEASAKNKAAHRVGSNDGRNWEIARQQQKAQTLNANAEDGGVGRRGAWAMNLVLALQRINYLNNHVLNTHEIWTCYLVGPTLLTLQFLSV